MLKKNYVILIVIILNLFYFFVELFYAHTSHSVALIADSLDFLEDALTNFFALIGLSLTIFYRKIIGYAILTSFIVPSLYALTFSINKIFHPEVPDHHDMILISIGAIIINCLCTILLKRYTKSRNFLLRAIYLSSRNDLIGNLLILLAAFLTLKSESFLPDFLVGVIILGINIYAVYEIKTMMNQRR